MKTMINSTSWGKFSLCLLVSFLLSKCLFSQKTWLGTTNDANQFPGQTWYKDNDSNDYSDGTNLVQCSRPTAYKTATELVNLEEDCNDDDPAINPGATEICNGIDDDCNGQVDEGTSGGMTYNGSVYFYSQADVDAFSQCYSVINGSMIIFGSTLNDLSNLSNLTEVTGSMTIYFTSLTSLAGLDQLVEVGLNLMVYYNFSLTDCCAIYDLINGGLGGAIVIMMNSSGCNSTAEINANCGSSAFISNNDPHVGASSISGANRNRTSDEPIN